MMFAKSSYRDGTLRVTFLYLKIVLIFRLCLLLLFLTGFVDFVRLRGGLCIRLEEEDFNLFPNGWTDPCYDRGHIQAQSMELWPVQQGLAVKLSCVFAYAQRRL